MLRRQRRLLNFHGGIGGWRVNKTNDIKLPTVRYEIVKNELIKIPVSHNKEIFVKDEYDTDAIIDEIVEKNPVLITAKIPGSGKSYIAEKMRDRGYKVLFVCSTNKLVQKYGKDAKTANVFFGISFGSSKLKPFDYSDYDVICFDEIYCHGMSVLNRIREFNMNNPDKIIIGTGDARQLKPIVDITNTQNHETYSNKCLDVMFKYRI